jgi:hypothetical protein
LKFLQQLPQARSGTSNSKPHWNHKVASVPLFPKLAWSLLQCVANFGNGALVRDPEKACPGRDPEWAPVLG